MQQPDFVLLVAIVEDSEGVAISNPNHLAGELEGGQGQGQEQGEE